MKKLFSLIMALSLSIAAWAQGQSYSTLQELVTEAVIGATGTTEVSYNGKAAVTMVDGDIFYIQDESGYAMKLLKGSTNEALKIGDVIGSFSGTYNREYNLFHTSLTSITKSEESLSIEAKSITANELPATNNAQWTAVSSKLYTLVKIENVKFPEQTESSFSANSSYDITVNSAKKEDRLKTDFASADYIGQALPTGEQTITLQGIYLLTQNIEEGNTNVMYDIIGAYSTIYITPRNKTDFVGFVDWAQGEEQVINPQESLAAVIAQTPEVGQTKKVTFTGNARVVAIDQETYYLYDRDTILIAKFIGENKPEMDEVITNAVGQITYENFTISSFEAREEEVEIIWTDIDLEKDIPANSALPTKYENKLVRIKDVAFYQNGIFEANKRYSIYSGEVKYKEVISTDDEGNEVVNTVLDRESFVSQPCVYTAFPNADYIGDNNKGGVKMDIYGIAIKRDIQYEAAFVFLVPRSKYDFWVGGEEPMDASKIDKNNIKSLTELEALPAGDEEYTIVANLTIGGVQGSEVYVQDKDKAMKFSYVNPNQSNLAADMVITKVKGILSKENGEYSFGIKSYEIAMEDPMAAVDFSLLDMANPTKTAPNKYRKAKLSKVLWNVNENTLQRNKTYTVEDAETAVEREVIYTYFSSLLSIDEYPVYGDTIDFEGVILKNGDNYYLAPTKFEITGKYVPSTDPGEDIEIDPAKDTIRNLAQLNRFINQPNVHLNFRGAVLVTGKTDLDELFLQDSTGSLKMLYNTAKYPASENNNFFIGSNLQVGDVITRFQGSFSDGTTGYVIDNITHFDVANITASQTVQALGNEPVEIKIIDVKENTKNARNQIGRLVCLKDVEMVSTGRFEKSYAYEVADGANSASIIYAFTKKANYINQEIPKGKRNIVGILSYEIVQDGSSSETRLMIFPRSLADFNYTGETGEQPIVPELEYVDVETIEDLREVKDTKKGYRYTGTALVTVKDKDYMWIQDETAGIKLSHKLGNVLQGNAITNLKVELKSDAAEYTKFRYEVNGFEKLSNCDFEIEPELIVPQALLEADDIKYAIDKLVYFEGVTVRESNSYKELTEGLFTWGVPSIVRVVSDPAGVQTDVVVPYFINADYIGAQYTTEKDTLDLTGVIIYAEGHFFMSPRSMDDFRAAGEGGNIQSFNPETAREKLLVSNGKLALYPNPSNGEFTISAPASSNTESVVRIVSNTGKEVRRINTMASELRISNLEKGFYIVSWQNSNSIYTAKLVVM